MSDKSSNTRRYVAIGLMAATIIISVVGSFLIIEHWEYISQLEEQGYLGLFFISIFAGSPIPIPTPSMILTFTLGSVLNPLLVTLVSGFGNAVGNVLIFWTGRGGHLFFKNMNFSTPVGEDSSSWMGRFLRKTRISRVPEIARRRGLLAVILLSIYPNPVLTPLILGMGAMRFNFWKFVLAIWVGKTAQSMILAYLGYFGLRYLLRFFGIFDAP